MSNTEPSRLGAAIQEGLNAAKKNLIPGSILCVCGVLLVLGYYQVAAIHGALSWIGGWQARLGPLLSVPSTAVFGGIVPLVFRRLFLKEGSTGRDYLFQILFWGNMGLQVFLLYELQAKLFGQDATWQSVLPKIFVDQFVYVPLAAVPCMVLGYLWKQCNYSLAETRAALARRGYWERCIPLLISNWGVWVPATAIIYSFPLALQVPLQNLILSIWVMLVILLTRDQKAD